ncbi:hypothetical protein T4A_12668 [Trichinella pseudospiralis]|uniref:Uncharacterized protein n=1 Tax=Trichinella pseudospiralis TaxID=6337 RepID=A0A0V1DP69_TRIPS|nr:hypothetical protein T4A_12668 [Trichinella pseudospiralis]
MSPENIIANNKCRSYTYFSHRVLLQDTQNNTAIIH